MKRHIFNIFALALVLILLLNGCGKQPDTDNVGTVGSVTTQFADDTTSSIENTGISATQGYSAVLMGHSFFAPFYHEIDIHAHNAGFVDHNQVDFFSGGVSGTPIRLWNNPEMSTDIKNALDTNDVTLFGMVYSGLDLSQNLEGYKNWIEYALQSNININIFIGAFWPVYPGSVNAEEYEAQWESLHANAHQIIDDLSKEYPGVNIYCIPYGQAAVELKKMWEAGELPEIPTQIGDPETSLFLDELGHPGRIVIDLGALIWLSAIYDVNLSDYDYDCGYSIDLKMIATNIMNSHDHEYDSR